MCRILIRYLICQMEFTAICKDTGEILQLIEKCALIIAGLAYKDEENDLLRAFLNRANRTGHLKQLLELFDTFAEEVGKIAIEDRDHELTKPVRSAQQYVMQHYAEPITLEDVCEYVGFSVSYFSALFKKETGEGFLEYLTKVRMEEAKTQLRETDASVVEICENIGYSDRKHFTHTFKKYTGLNPAEYRKIYG